jgi:hypothetical protein
MTDENQSSASVAAVRIKVPAFLEASASAWFRILEAQFHLSNITTERTRFFHTLANLPPEVVSRISPSELDSASYDTLKSSILALYERSKSELFQEFVAKQPYTGRPSSYLRDILNSAAKLGVSDDIVRLRFIDALPNNLRPTLTAQTSLSLEALGALANDLVSLTISSLPTPAPVCAVSPPYPAPSYEPRYSPSSNSRFSQSSAMPSSLPIGFRPFYADQKPRVCRAHLYFASQAKTCKPWCLWPNRVGLHVQTSSRPSSPVSHHPPSASRSFSPSRSSSPIPSSSENQRSER